VLLTLLIAVLVIYVPSPMRGFLIPLGWVPVGVLAVLCAHALLCQAAGRVARALHSGRSQAAGLRALRVLVLPKLSIVFLTILTVYVLRWPLLVEWLFSPVAWLPGVDDVLLLLPTLVMIVTAMAFRYGFERKAHRVRLTLLEYVVLRLRTEIGILLAPWFIFVLVSDATLTAFGGSPHYEMIDLFVSLGLMLVVITFAPLLLRLVWRTSPLPAGPLRDRLEALCRAQHFRCRQILVWHTRNHMPNAGVIGMVPWMRYVLLSDALLAHCSEEEVEGIFAHEIGHIKNHHLSFYLLFAAGFTCFYANVVDLLARFGWVSPIGNMLVDELTSGQAVIMLIFAALYWVLVFGYLSRRLEQQADLFSLRAASVPMAFVSALQKLGSLSGAARRAGSWRHFSISRRTAFLRQAVAHPERALKTERFVQTVQLVIIFLFVISCARALLW